jgi:hypothetical protein
MNICTFVVQTSCVNLFARTCHYRPPFSFAVVLASARPALHTQLVIIGRFYLRFTCIWVRIQLLDCALLSLSRLALLFQCFSLTIEFRALNCSFASTFDL